MNKNELIDAIADEADLSKASAGRALDAAINAITAALKNQDTVSLVGFGTFSVKHWTPRFVWFHHCEDSSPLGQPDA